MMNGGFLIDIVLKELFPPKPEEEKVGCIEENWNKVLQYMREKDKESGVSD